MPFQAVNLHGVVPPLLGAAFTEEPLGLFTHSDKLIRSFELGQFAKEVSFTIAVRGTAGFGFRKPRYWHHRACSPYGLCLTGVELS